MGQVLTCCEVTKEDKELEIQSKLVSFMKQDMISEDNFISKAETGDILLFKTNKFFSKLHGLMENSMWGSFGTLGKRMEYRRGSSFTSTTATAATLSPRHR